MKELTLFISDQAIEDLMELWLYVANDSPQSADKFIDHIQQQCLLICSTPKIGRERGELLPGLRSLPVKRYIVYYRIKNEVIEIVRVMSGYRDIEQF
ncbi:MAG: type II toxin-antitoxin system RelE/ParE family toxin [Proteobacteria bacterium]|nr:type II toxin-antitoxin system RelE/ParE family toxin [Pseudomonadota bacterium]MBU1709947.1 type II toxin-antitoxin system RelE/ParE family toxin [Pseudomonadota bacterium]